MKSRFLFLMLATANIFSFQAIAHQPIQQAVVGEPVEAIFVGSFGWEELTQAVQKSNESLAALRAKRNALANAPTKRIENFVFASTKAGFKTKAPHSSNAQINLSQPTYPTPQKLDTAVLAGTATDLPGQVPRHPNASAGVGHDQYVIYSYCGGRCLDKETLEIDPVFDTQVQTFFPPTGVDERIKYDPMVDRWYLTAGDLQGLGLGYPNAGTLNFAVSDSGTLTPFTRWNVFIIAGDTIASPGDYMALDLDYNNPGVDQHALYIALDNFDELGNYANSTAYVIEKSTLLAGQPFITAFRNLVDPTNEYDGIGSYYPSGVDNFDKNPEFGYLIGLPNQIFSAGTFYYMYRIANPGSTSRANPPTISSLTSPIQLYIGETQIYYNLGAPLQGNLFGAFGELIPGISPNSPHIRNGQLYFTFELEVDRFGNSGNGLEDRTGVRWVQYDLKGGQKKEQLSTTPILTQGGQLFDPTDTLTPLFYQWPSLMTNKRNDIVLAYTTSSANSYINAYFAGRLGSSPQDGTLGTPVSFYQSTSSYNAYIEFGDFLERFGDTTCTNIDPCDELTFWTIAQVVPSPNMWGLAVAKIRSPKHSK